MLTIEHVSKTYHNHHHNIIVFQNVNFSLPDNGLVLLTGESGSGKTTLLNLLNSTERPTTGQIRYRGTDISHMSNHYLSELTATILQEGNLISFLTVREQIKFTLSFLSKSNSDIEVDQCLKNFDLTDQQDSYPDELSTGQRLRCSIAMAIMKKPIILFADEPFASVDKENAEIISDLLIKLAETTLVIVSSHNNQEIQSYCKAIIHIEHNEVTYLEKTLTSKASSITEQPIEESINVNKFCLAKAMIKKHPFEYLKIVPILLVLFLSISLLLSFIYLNYGFSAHSNLKADQGVLYLNHNYVLNHDLNYIYNVGFSDQDIQKYQSTEGVFDVLLANDMEIEYTGGADAPYSGEITGVVSYPNNVSSDELLSIKYGKEPKVVSSTYCEVAITDFMYDYYERYGFYSFEIQNESNIIGKKYEHDGIIYEITGIIRTQYSETQPLNFFPDSFQTNEDETKYQERLQLEIYTKFFVPESYFVIHSSQTDDSFELEGLHTPFRLSTQNSNLFLSNQIDLISNVYSEVSYLLDPQQTELSQNDIIINIHSLNETAIQQRIKISIEDYALNHFEEIKEEYLSDFPDGNAFSYSVYIIQNEVNEYDLARNYSYFKNMVYNAYLNELNSEDVHSEVDSILGNIDLSVRIIGITENEEGITYVSKYIFDSLTKLSYSKQKTIVILTSNRLSEVSSLLNEEVKKMNILNPSIGPVYDFMKSILTITPLFQLIFMVLIFISVIVLMIYFHFFTKKTSSDMGKLLILGYGKKKTKYLYLVHNLWMQSILLLTSFLGLIGIVYLVNLKLTETYKLTAQVLAFRGDLYLISFLGFCFISMFVQIIFLWLSLDLKPVRNLYYHEIQ